jgi:hypothetical protein
MRSTGVWKFEIGDTWLCCHVLSRFFKQGSSTNLLGSLFANTSRWRSGVVCTFPRLVPASEVLHMKAAMCVTIEMKISNYILAVF